MVSSLFVLDAVMDSCLSMVVSGQPFLFDFVADLSLLQNVFLEIKAVALVVRSVRLTSACNR